MLREGTDIATLVAIVIVGGLAIYQAWRLEVAMEKGLGKVEAVVKKVEEAVGRRQLGGWRRQWGRSRGRWSPLTHRPHTPPPPHPRLPFPPLLPPPPCLPWP